MVIFCALVGSITLSRQLDPEDPREAARSYQQLCAAIVAMLDAFVVFPEGEPVDCRGGLTQRFAER